PGRRPVGIVVVVIVADLGARAVRPDRNRPVVEAAIARLAAPGDEPSVLALGNRRVGPVVIADELADLGVAHRGNRPAHRRLGQETQPALALARPPVDIFGETRASPGAGAGAGVAAGIGRCPAGRTADAAPGRLDRILDRSHVGLGRRAGVGVRRFDLWR